MTEFMVKSRHAEELASGRPLSPGDRFELSSEEQEETHNKERIEAGVFASLEPPKSEKGNGKKKKEGGDES